MLYNIIASEIPDSCAARPANGTSSRRKRKPGRPKLPRGNAKNKIVPIRFTKAEAEQLAKAAKANKRLPKQTIRPFPSGFVALYLPLWGRETRCRGFG